MKTTFILLTFFCIVLLSCTQSTQPDESKTTSTPEIASPLADTVSKGPVKISLIDEKTRIGKGSSKAKYRWYTFYVENYADNQETQKKMIEVAKKLPVDGKAGFTEVFFFNDKVNAPKLEADGGWAPDESQNSWNQKYGKFCIGYYSAGAGEEGSFSKSWD